MGISLGFVVENALTAVLIIAYIGYEIHYGRLNTLTMRMEGVTDAIVALSRQVEGVDERAVIDRIDGTSPNDFIISTQRGPVRSSRDSREVEDD